MISCKPKQADNAVSTDYAEKAVEAVVETTAEVPTPPVPEAPENGTTGTVEKTVLVGTDVEPAKPQPPAAKSETNTTKPATTAPTVETTTVAATPTPKPLPKTAPALPTTTAKPATPVAEPTKPAKPTTTKPAQPSTDKPIKPAPQVKIQGSPTHKEWDGMLAAHVSSSGVVDYKGLKVKEAELDQYLTTLAEIAPQPSWSSEEELAYWINLYNAATVKLILKNYPLKSITNLHGGKPWDVKWVKSGDKTYSLNNIENDIIRPRFNEPRIHFAVNCAAVSCPPLANQAFTAKNLESLMNKQTKAFINNASYNTLSKNDITISKIFDWYGEDFGNVATFVARYADTSVSPTAKVNFSEYDWSLNGK